MGEDETKIRVRTFRAVRVAGDGGGVKALVLAHGGGEAVRNIAGLSTAMFARGVGRVRDGQRRVEAPEPSP